MNAQAPLQSWEDDSVAQAIRKVMIDQTEYYGTVHGPNSAEYNRIVSVGFGLATELFGSDPETPGRREFIRWLFGKDES